MRWARSSAFLIAALVLVAINLRPAAAAVGPLIHRIRDDTGLSAAGAGLLVTLPVLCFGALAPLAPVLARRLGPRATVACALAALGLGLVVRLVPGLAFLFAGTILAGAAIAVANVLLPVLVRRDFPERAGVVTGLYSSALIGFAAVSAGVSVPLANALGGGWRPALAIWAAPAAIALLAWVPEVRLGRRALAAQGWRIGGVRPLLGDRVAWALTLFFALQSAGFYATLAWLPSIFQSHGASEARAGLLLSVTILVGVPAALTVPTLAVRVRDQRALAAGFSACIALGWLGVLIAPMAAPYVWAVLIGVGQNACFPLALTLIVLRAGSVTNTSRLSTMVQTIGYLIAAAAPLIIGALHDLTGSWTVALIVLLALVAPQALAGLAAGRPGTVDLA
ncbi:MAG: MFS transporter [Solirubrobacterales bacterium]|nr:MFS transporter [Solirubrobacterales bacterium]